MQEIQEKEKGFQITSGLLARNTVLNFVGQAIPLLIGIVTIPFVIAGLGVDRFGILSISWIVIGYISLFDLGLGRATTKFVAEAIGKGETENLPYLIWTSFGVHVLLGIAGGLLLLYLTPPLIEKAFNIPPVLMREARDTFFILSLSLPLILASAALRAVLEASQRFDLVNAVNIPYSSLTFLLPALGVFGGLGLSGIVVLLMISRFIAAVVYLILCLKTFVILKKVVCFELKLIRKLISYGGWITVSNVVGPVSAYFDRFIIGAVLTMASVSYYTVPYEIVIRLWIIPASMVMTLFPAFSALGFAHEEDLRVLFIRTHKYLLLAVGPIVIGLALFAGDILQMWLGPDFANQSTTVFQVLAISALAGCMAPISGGLIQGLGRPDIISKVYLLYFLPNAGIIWLLIHRMGIKGAALSFAIRVIIDTAIFFTISLRLIHLPLSSFLGKGFMKGSFLLLLFGTTLLLTSFLKVGLPSQIILFVMAIGAYAVAAWHCVLDEVDKKVLKSATSKFFPDR